MEETELLRAAPDVNRVKTTEEEEEDVMAFADNIVHLMDATNLRQK